MNLSAAIAALLAGIIVWALLVRQLTAKPWETPGVPAAGSSENISEWPPTKVGLWTFLAVVTSLFALFMTAYYMRMSHDNTGGGHDWRSFAKPAILWFNTAVLILSSVAMQFARSAMTLNQAARVRFGLTAGGSLTLVFLLGQLLAWRELQADGYFLQGNPAAAFFYVLTAVHGVHLLGGLFVWGRGLLRLRSEAVELVDLRLTVELCTVYWHYLLFVWLALFALLLVT